MYNTEARFLDVIGTKVSSAVQTGNTDIAVRAKEQMICASQIIKATLKKNVKSLHAESTVSAKAELLRKFLIAFIILRIPSVNLVQQRHVLTQSGLNDL